MKYLVITEKNDRGIWGFEQLVTEDFKKAVKRWEDERYCIERDRLKNTECHIVDYDAYYDGNYEYLDEDLKWHAVMANDEDDDWGTGSFFLDEAQAKLKSYPNGYIAVIQNDVCIDEIRD